MKIGKRISLQKNFFLDEFFPKETYLEKTQEEMEAMLDPTLPLICQKLRKIWGPMLINSWWYPEVTNPRNYAGWRPKNCTVGAKKSMHKEGRAVDPIFLNISADEVRRAIIADNQRFFDMGIRRIENEVSWLHLDTKQVARQKEIIFFNP